MHRETRRRAAELFAAGRSRADVARELSVTRATAGTWYRRWLTGGEAALTAERPRGRPARLAPAVGRLVARALTRPPREHGYDLDAWSLAAVAAFVERETGARFHHRHVGRLLRRLGWVVPPIGAGLHAALHHQPARDPEGNAFLLQVRPRPPASRDDDGDEAG